MQFSIFFCVAPLLVSALTVPQQTLDTGSGSGPSLVKRDDTQEGTPTTLKRAAAAEASPLPRLQAFRAIASNEKLPALHLKPITEHGGSFYINGKTTTSNAKCPGKTFTSANTAFRLNTASQFDETLYLANVVKQQVFVTEEGRLKVLTEQEPKMKKSDIEKGFVYAAPGEGAAHGSLQFRQTKILQWRACKEDDGAYSVNVAVPGASNTDCEDIAIVTDHDTADPAACEST